MENFTTKLILVYIVTLFALAMWVTYPSNAMDTCLKTQSVETCEHTLK